MEPGGLRPLTSHTDTDIILHVSSPNMGPPVSLLVPPDDPLGEDRRMWVWDRRVPPMKVGPDRAQRSLE